MTNRTARPPAAHPRSPMILVDGPDASGATVTALQLAADDRFGLCYVVEVGKSDAAAYSDLADFVLVDHDGGLDDIARAIRWVIAQPPIDDRPPVLVIDCGSDLWGLVRSDAEARARSSKETTALLEADPYAEVVIGATHWNAAKDEYLWPWLRQLRTWPGITVVTADSEDLPVWDEGRPTSATVTRLDLERDMAGRFDTRIRTTWPRPPRLVWSHKVGIVPPVELPVAGTIAHVITDLLDLVPSSFTYLPRPAKQIVHQLAIARGLSADEAVALAQMVWSDLELDAADRIDLSAVALACERVREATDDATEAA